MSDEKQQQQQLSDETLKDLQQAQNLKSRGQQILQRIEDFNLEANDHLRVIETLKEIDPKRTCYRKVGELLVERDVGSVIPELEYNLKRIQEVMKTLEEQRQASENEAENILKHHGPVLEEIGKARAAQQQM